MHFFQYSFSKEILLLKMPRHYVCAPNNYLEELFYSTVKVYYLILSARSKEYNKNKMISFMTCNLHQQEHIITDNIFQI